MRVFISYTAEDLKGHADVVQDVLRRLEWIAIDHRDWAPDGRPSVGTCERKIKSCDIVVLMIAHRYGWVPPRDQGGDDETSITWMEYKWARELGKPVVPYIVDEKARWPADLYEIRTNPGIGPRLEAFKVELRKGSVGFFTEDSGSLLAKLQDGLNAAAQLVGGIGANGNVPAGAVSSRSGNSVRPAKLPYRCDRIPQASLLRFAVKQHVQTGVRRPLICMVHGRSDEAHQPFVERVENDTVTSAPAGSDYQFCYLSKTQPAQSESFATQIRRELAEKLLRDECEDDLSLVKRLQERQIPMRVFCTVPLRLSECGGRAAQILHGIHHYWQEFPDLPPSLLIVCIVCFKFDEPEAGMLDRMGRMFGRRSITTQAVNTLAALEVVGREDPRAPLYVLPKLISVGAADIDRWLTEARDSLARYVTDVEIKAVLGRHQRAPMDTVISFLEGLIRT